MSILLRLVLLTEKVDALSTLEELRGLYTSFFTFYQILLTTIFSRAPAPSDHIQNLLEPMPAPSQLPQSSISRSTIIFIAITLELDHPYPSCHQLHSFLSPDQWYRFDLKTSSRIGLVRYREALLFRVGTYS
jgi:hypothetical protein